MVVKAVLQQTKYADCKQNKVMKIECDSSVRKGLLSWWVLVQKRKIGYECELWVEESITRCWCPPPPKPGFTKLSEHKSSSTKSNTYRSNPWHELSIWNVARRRREKEHRLESRGGPVALTNWFCLIYSCMQMQMYNGMEFFRFFIFYFFRERNSEPKP